MAEEELYKKYRPQKLADVVGQKEAVTTLTQMGKSGSLPHFLLFSGPSGTGKTTVARILRKLLKCSDADWNEINAADSRGIDTIREITSRMGSSPMGGSSRIWCIDEAHKLTTDAQNAFLKPLEDTPKHVYFFFCTTDPQKLIKTVVTRSTEVVFKAVSQKDLAELVRKVAEAEGVKISDDVANKIAEVAEGSPRKTLVLLHQVIRISDEAEQMKAIEAADVRAAAYTIAQKLMKEGTKWAEMGQLLKSVEEDPETIRWMVLGYAKSVLLNSGSSRAAVVIDQFRDNFYDSKHAGLAIACYNVING